MRMTTRRWIGIIFGISLFLAAFSIAMALTVFQVSRQIGAELVLSGVEVLADENLGIYWDGDDLHGVQRCRPRTALAD